MTDLTIGGETFNVLIEGDETLPVLMLSNPLGANLHIWDAQMPELLKHFRTVRYNPRGHGSSVADTGPYSIGQLAGDALSILDALGIERTHWLGASLGGAVGQWLLINAPERIERAVLANTAARFGSPEMWNERIVVAQEHGMEALADTTIERWFSADFAASQSERVDEIKQALLATSPEGYAAAAAALRDLDLREGLLRIQHPVLVICGSDDAAAPPEQAALLAQAITGAKLVTLETRHISAVEDADGFTKAAVDFLTSKIAVRQSSTRKAPLPRPIARRPAGRRSPATRGATTDTLARRAPVKGITREAKAASAPVAKGPVAKTSRAKPTAAARKGAIKPAIAQAAPDAKVGRKPRAAAAPAKRTGSKPATPANRSVAKAISAKATSRSAAPKAGAARKTGVVASAKRTKAVKTAEPVVAKAATRKAAPRSPARVKAVPARRGTAKPAVVAAKKTTKGAAAKPGAARRGTTVAKVPAKRTGAVAAKSRAVTKTKGSGKATAKPARAVPTKARATPGKAKASMKSAAAKPAARKPAAKAAARRAAPRRKP